MSNKMKDVAKVLGVEFGEEFNIVGCFCNPYRIKEGGLLDSYGSECPMMFSSLLKGISTIQKILWKPKEGEMFYFVAGGCVVLCCSAFNHDNKHIAVGNCFKTQDEAQRVADKLKIFFKEVDCNE